MSRLRILFLSALAKTTCFDLLDGEPPRRLSEASAFVAAIEALKGIAYSAIACLLFWLLRSQTVAGIIATAAICILHSRIANKSRPPSPARLRMLFFPKLDDSPYFEPLAVLLLPGLTLFLLLMGGALWLPTILAVSAAAALEISGTRNDSGDKEKLFRVPLAWVVAASTALLFTALPTVFLGVSFRDVALRLMLLFAAAIISAPKLARLPNLGGYIINQHLAAAFSLAAAIIILAY